MRAYSLLGGSVSAKIETLWQAEPHTIAKIDMLRSYLYQWFTILGISSAFRGKDLWYIDGFAGPGEYTNYSEGSPVAALSAARAAITSNPKWQAGDVRCLFIEEDNKRYQHLRRKLSEVASHPKVHFDTFAGTFNDGVGHLKKQSVNPFTSASPLFAFIDPFGPKGMSFARVRELLSHGACEVLINLDSDGVDRIYKAGASANHDIHLNDVFGDSEWESEMAGVPRKDIIGKVVALYKRKLRGLPDVRYAFSFEMRNQSSFDYHLVFATKHPRGLEKMKEVMKKFDQSGAYSFSDDHIGQDSLFNFNDPSIPAQHMKKYFLGKTVSYAQIVDYALNDSPYTNPKAMLKLLEKSNQIAVECALPGRVLGTYPDKYAPVIKVRF